MSIIALDLGRRRIGVAVSSGSLPPQALQMIERRSPKHDLECLRTLIRQWEPEAIVVGLPLNMDGSEGPAARNARDFADWLAQRFELTVELHDERLSSFEARQRLKGVDRPRTARKAMVDSMAAALILEQWLLSRSRQAPSSDEPRCRSS